MMERKLKMRIQLKELIQLEIDPNIFVKVYDLGYAINIKIYQKELAHGTELYVNVDLDKSFLSGIYDDFEQAIEDYIRENLRLGMEYHRGDIHYFISLRSYRPKN
ncbi:MAG: hypothetical protein ACRDAO_07400 [Culicoidibacterales bacterium]